MNWEQVQFAKRFDGISGSAIREIFKLLAVPDMISFAGGNPSLNALPDELVMQAAQKALQQDGKAILQYGATEGYPPFRESLAPYLTKQFGFPVTADEVLPVTGSTQAMDLLCKALINPGDVILVESPTFLGNMQCMRLYEAKLVPVESDEGGIVASALEAAIKAHKPKLLYTIPTFQNPTGRTLAADRRPRIAALAEEYGFVVAEDDPYRDLRYEGEALPTIKSYDKAGMVAFMGSFSKVISPGLRVGFLAAAPSILRRCTIGKQSSDLHTASLNQAIVDIFLRDGLLGDHIKRICGEYAKQCSAMLTELASFPEGTRYTHPEGGLFVFVTLPEGIDAKALLQKAVARKVAYVPGTFFYPDGGHENTLRLNFSNSSVEKIHEGMKILRNVIEEEMKA